MLLQLLPQALKAQGRSAMAVFCDLDGIRSIDRTFLWMAMAHLKVGGRLPARDRGLA